MLIEPVPAGDSALDALLGFTGPREACTRITDGEKRSGAASGQSAKQAEAGISGTQVYRNYAPRTGLIVAGSDSAAIAIAGMAGAIDMETVLVWPQGPPQPPPLPDVAYVRSTPTEALGEVGIDRWTAIAACTHDHDLDEETLLLALRLQAYLVGALGSERRRPWRLEALRAAGLGDAELARLKTLIGLPIGARSPWEIAVSTIAEIVAAERRGYGA